MKKKDFEKLADEIELVDNKEKGFTKADLKTGMIVETRDEERYIVIKNTKMYKNAFDIIINNYYVCFIDNYKNDLSFVDNNMNLDIVKVYLSKSVNLLDAIQNKLDLELIWQRKEEKEETPKPQLTERERAYLKAYSYDYEWVARNESNDLFWFKDKPMKGYHYWGTDKQRSNSECWYSLVKSFDFIKWEDEEPYRIKDLLGDKE